MPDTRPEQVFSVDGICDACLSAEKKHKTIDWSKRREELAQVLDCYRRTDNSWWDCIIPVSGGKDSCYQAYSMKYEFGMNPLCVNFVPCEMTELGLNNLLFLRDLGFDIIQVGANRRVYRQMARKGFFDLGDCCWPEHIGVFTAPVRVAVQYQIPLIVWGENSQFEYGGPASSRNNRFLDRNWLEQFQMLGYRISDLYEEGFGQKDLLTFEYPADSELEAAGITGLFLGYYIKWDSIENYRKMTELGWNPNLDGPVEGAYYNFENLDCKWIGGLHDYMKFLKYGYGRATDQLCSEIRNGRIERDHAIQIVRQFEGRLPRKYIADFIRFIDCTEREFREVLDRFTSPTIFHKKIDGSFETDQNGNLIKIDYGY